MNRRRWDISRLMAVPVTLAVLAAIWGGPGAPGAAGQAPESIKVGVVVSLTGPLAGGGKWVTQGYDIGVKHVNEAGGVNLKEFGKRIPLQLIYLDNESDPKKVASRMERLSSVEKVDVFLGGFAAFLVVPQLAVAEKFRTPIIGTTLSSEEEFAKGYRYIFTPFVSTRDQVRTFLDVLETIPPAERPKRIAFFEIQELWGVETAKHLKEMAAARGYEIVAHDKHSMAATDLSSLIINAKSARADALYTTPTPAQGITMMKQMKELDWMPKFPLVLRSADDVLWSKNLGRDGDYVFHNGGGWDHHLKLPGVEKFNRDYRAAYGYDPEAIAGSAYANVQILANALERAGTLDKEKVRDAIAATKMMTVLGAIQFKPNGRAEGYVRAMSQWQNGRRELIWPKEHASAPMAYPAPPWSRR